MSVFLNEGRAKMRKHNPKWATGRREEMPHVRARGELGRGEPWPEVSSLGQKEIFEPKQGRPPVMGGGADYGWRPTRE